MLAFLVATMHVEHSTRNLAVLDAAAKIAEHSATAVAVSVSQTRSRKPGRR